MSFKRQVSTVLLIESIIIIIICLIAWSFWSNMCADSWASCIGAKKNLFPWQYLLLSTIRPLLFSPVLLFSLVAGDAFGPYGGTALSAVGATLSAIVLFIPSLYLYERLTKTWLVSNIPSTLKLIRKLDWRLVFLSRWLPFMPFDIMTIIFGALGFRLRSVVIGTFLGILPEAYMFARITGTPHQGVIMHTIYTVTIFGLATLLPLIIFDIFGRKRGRSIINRFKLAYEEILNEISSNNRLNKRSGFEEGKIPVILLYGFWSSRKALHVMERMLRSRGFSVVTFNLGGTLGHFNTRGIKDSARFIDYKIKRMMRRHDIDQVQIFAHSKGGLVAAHWLLKLGGHRYCKTLVTSGTPFKGTWLVWLALVSPFGLFWPDVWQMRKNSVFLKELNKSKIPDDLKIYNLYSDNDNVSTGEDGIFEPNEPSKNIVPIPIHHISHFEFLYKREVCDTVASLLKEK